MWILKPDERLKHWKDFRDGLDLLPLEESLKETSHLWSYVPFVNYYLSPDQETPWPDPWTILYENYYCDIAKALGMIYTIYFTNHRDEISAELRIYFDPETKTTYNVAWFNNGEYILNLEFNKVVNKESINKSFELKHRYTADDLKLNQY